LCADPEVGTLTTLTNVQNSLFVPDIPYLGNFLNRRPTYTLTQRPADLEKRESSVSDDADVDSSKAEPRLQAQRTYTGATMNTISSRVNDKYYAVLPHGVSLPGWTEEEKFELNDHVRHMLHSRRSKFKRSMKGFGQYVRKRKYFSMRTKNWTNCEQLLGSLLLSTQHSSPFSALPGFFS
jgi:hypothetical protein